MCMCVCKRCWINRSSIQWNYWIVSRSEIIINVLFRLLWMRFCRGCGLAEVSAVLAKALSQEQRSHAKSGRKTMEEEEISIFHLGHVDTHAHEPYQYWYGAFLENQQKRWKSSENIPKRNIKGLLNRRNMTLEADNSNGIEHYAAHEHKHSHQVHSNR